MNDGGKGHIHQQFKTGYKSKVVKLSERHDEWRSGVSSLFNLEKSPVASLCYYGEWWDRIYGNRCQGLRK